MGNPLQQVCNGIYISKCNIHKGIGSVGTSLIKLSLWSCVSVNLMWVSCSLTRDGRHQGSITSPLLEQTCTVPNQRTWLSTVQVLKVPTVSKGGCVHSIILDPFFPQILVTSHAINLFMGTSMVISTVQILVISEFVIFSFGSKQVLSNWMIDKLNEDECDMKFIWRDQLMSHKYSFYV